MPVTQAGLGLRQPGQGSHWGLLPILLLLLPGHAMNGSAELWQSRVGLDLSSPETSLTSLSLVSLFAVAQ